MVSTSHGVRSQQGNDFIRAETTGIGKSVEDSCDRIRRQRNETIRRNLSCVLSSGQELELRSSRALSEAGSTCELDEIGGGDIVVGQEWSEEVD